MKRLLEWADAWPERTWAVEGAGGLGHLLAQQLLAAGERVLDVQPKLAARVRLLADEAVNKNDPNDARSVAVTALRSRTRREAVADDHSTVLKLRSKRRRDLARGRTQIACRLHAALCELVPGGIGKEITAAHAARILEQVTPSDAVQRVRRELAADLVDDLRRADDLLREADRKLATAVRAAGTTLTEIFGVGPVIAATVIGEVRDVARFASRDAFAACNGTAPIEVSSGKRKVYRLSRRGNRNLNHAIHMAAVTQVRYPRSEGRAYYDKKLAEGKTGREAPARPQTPGQRRDLQAAARRCRPRPRERPGPGRARGERLHCQRGQLTPRMPALRHSHSRATAHPTATAMLNEKDQLTASQESHQHPLTQRGIDMFGLGALGIQQLTHAEQVDLVRRDRRRPRPSNRTCR